MSGHVGTEHPRAGLLRPGSTHRCRPRGTAPGLLASRTRTLVTLPQKLWGSCKPTHHVGRTLGEQCCFLKTQQLQCQKRWPHTVLPSHSEPTHTARIKITAAPSAPSGLGPAWGPGACVPHKLPPGLGQTGSAEPAPGSWTTASPTNTYRSGGQHRGLGPVLTTHNGVLAPPPERLVRVDRDRQRGGTSQQGTERPKDPRQTRGPPRPTPTDQLSEPSTCGILRDHLTALSPSTTLPQGKQVAWGWGGRPLPQS